MRAHSSTIGLDQCCMTESTNHHLSFHISIIGDVPLIIVEHTVVKAALCYDLSSLKDISYDAQDLNEPGYRSD